MSKTRIPVQSASAEYLRTMERKKIVRRIDAVGKAMDENHGADLASALDATAMVYGFELADEEANAISIGIATGLVMAAQIASEEDESQDGRIAEITRIAALTTYYLYLNEKEEDETDG